MHIWGEDIGWEQHSQAAGIAWATVLREGVIGALRDPKKGWCGRATFEHGTSNEASED